MEQLYDIYGMSYTPLWRMPWFMYLWGTIGITAIGGMFFCFYKWYKRRTLVFLSPWEKAIKNLERLELTYGQESPSRIYMQVTEHLKECIQEKYGYAIASKTDQELVIYLEEKMIDSFFMQEVRFLLCKSSEIKFGRELMSHDTIKSDLIRTKQLVEKMAPCQKTVSH